MALVTLKKVSSPVAGGTFAVRWWQYDIESRIETQDVTSNATPQDFELAVDALVPNASFCVGTTRREVRYAGDGKVYTLDVADSPTCAFGPARLDVAADGSTLLAGDTGAITAAWSMAGPPYLVSCGLMEPGIDGAASTFYQEASTAGTLLQFSGFVAPTAGISRGGQGIPCGRYRVRVTSQATGQTIDKEVIVPPIMPASVVINGPQNGAGRDRVLLYQGTASLQATNVGRTVSSDGPLTIHEGILTRSEGPASDRRITFTFDQLFASITPGYTLLSLTYYGVTEDTATVNVTLYKNGNVTSHSCSFTVEDFLSPPPNLTQLLPYTRYCLPAGEVLLESPIEFFGDQLSDGEGGIYYRRQSATRPIEAANIIYFHPPRPGEATGGIIVEVPEQAQADGPVLLFELLSADGTTVLESNATGRFGLLGTDNYKMRVTAPSSAVLLPLLFDFSLRAEYRLAYYLDFADLHNNQACRLEMWVRNYEGLPKQICGQAEVVELDQQGIEAGALQADVPSSVGSSLRLLLRAESGELQDLVLDDRACRVDLYYCGYLEFSGYVEAGDYTESLLGGMVDVELLATDGLAELRNTDFAGDHGQELRGRYPAINTLLHCLSRTSLSAPFQNITNRRALEMTTAEVMETAAFTERRAYLEEKGLPLDCRTVVDAICQAFGGTLFQGRGMWQIASLLEASADAPARRYTAAGSPDPLTPTLTVASPTTAIRPATIAGLGEWFWLDASQARRRRPGWKSLSAEGNIGYTNNLFRTGDCFSLPLSWDESGTALLPTTGWRAGSATAGTNSFGLRLVEIEGVNGSAYTQWPIPNGGSNYLESEVLPLAPGREGLPMVLSVTAKLQSRLINSKLASVLFTELFVEIIADDADGKPHSFGHTLRFDMLTDASSALTTVSRRLPVGLPVGLTRPRVRLHPAKGTKLALPGISPLEFGYLLVAAVQLQPLPQGVAWESETSFTALGPGGTTRPTQPLLVFHGDTPAAAGIYAGNPAAFLRTVSRGVAGPTTQWARASDLLPAPLLAQNVLDVLALRANPSQVLTGIVGHRATVAGPGTQPQLFDSVDTPYEPDGVTGRRWAVVGRTWNVKKARTDITMLEIGEGEYLVPPVHHLPAGARLINGLTQGKRRTRITDRGYRIVNT